MLKAKECLDSSHCFSCVFLWAYQFQFQVSCRVVRLKNEVMEDSEDCGDMWRWRHLHQAAPRPQTEPRVEPARGATGTRVNRSTGLKSYQLFLSLL
jgi:hypothetical protein